MDYWKDVPGMGDNLDEAIETTDMLNADSSKSVSFDTKGNVVVRAGKTEVKLNKSEAGALARSLKSFKV